MKKMLKCFVIYEGNLHVFSSDVTENFQGLSSECLIDSYIYLIESPKYKISSIIKNTRCMRNISDNLLMDKEIILNM